MNVNSCSVHLTQSKVYAFLKETFLSTNVKHLENFFFFFEMCLMLCRSVSLKYREWKRPCFFTVLQCLVAQSCPALCNPVDCSPPGSSVHRDSPGQNAGVGCHALLQGIFPTPESNPGLLHCRWILYCLSHQGSPRILEWVAMPFSRGSSQPRNQTQVSCIEADSIPAEPPGKPMFLHNWRITTVRSPLKDLP